MLKLINHGKENQTSSLYIVSSVIDNQPKRRTQIERQILINVESGVGKGGSCYKRHFN